MLKDDVKKMKEKNPDLVTTTKAACRYCGQFAEVEILLNWGVQEAETVATEMCVCSQAKTYTRKMRSRENAKKRVNELFCNATIADAMHQDISVFLCKVIDAVADGVIEKASFEVKSGIKAAISYTKRGSIKVQRVIKNDASFEE